MKKLILALVFLVAFFTINAQVKQPPQSKPVSTWEALLSIIDQSNANHLQVKEVQQVILTQLQTQLAAQQKAISDTTIKKK